jgi:hypothetical protein
MTSFFHLGASVFGLDTTDLTSTTTGLDSMLDGNTENNSSDDLSTTVDTTDAHAIRKQLEGLENMYSEVSLDYMSCTFVALHGTVLSGCFLQIFLWHFLAEECCIKLSYMNNFCSMLFNFLTLYFTTV